MTARRTNILAAGLACPTLLISFIAYCVMKTQGGSGGFEPIVSAQSAIYAVIAGVVVGLVYLVLLATLLACRAAIQSRRAPSCEKCGYSLIELIADTCPECGSHPARAKRPLHDMSRTMIALVICWVSFIVLAPAVGEAYLLIEEAVFRSEAAAKIRAGQTGNHVRRRWWPSGDSSLVYDPISGRVFNTG